MLHHKNNISSIQSNCEICTWVFQNAIFSLWNIIFFAGRFLNRFTYGNLSTINLRNFDCNNSQFVLLERRTLPRCITYRFSCSKLRCLLLLSTSSRSRVKKCDIFTASRQISFKPIYIHI